MGIKLLGDICSRCKLDNHTFSFGFVWDSWRQRRAMYVIITFPQADGSVLVYVELSIGIEVNGSTGHLRQNELQLWKCICHLKQNPTNGHTKLKKGLELQGFNESIVYPCNFRSTARRFGTTSHIQLIMDSKRSWHLLSLLELSITQ